MKKTKIAYWIVTGLFAAFMLFSAIPDIMYVSDAITMISTQLGYPAYLIRFLGVAKLLGVIVILLPGFSQLKEWAYAGLFFDLFGAMYSIICIKEHLSQSLPFFILIFIFFFGSYILYHKKLKEVQ